MSEEPIRNRGAQPWQGTGHAPVRAGKPRAPLLSGFANCGIICGCVFAETL